MSVSLTHVQAALQNHLTSGGSALLTLNVLHKTDSLVSQLAALNKSKPVTVEVLKALPNGRAEVLAGGLKLDVKASLPLKTGEIFHLKLEQTGSALRFVQTIGVDANSAKPQMNTGQPIVNNGTQAQAASPQHLSAQQLSAGVKQPVAKGGPLSTSSSQAHSPQAGATLSINSNSASNSSSLQGGQNSSPQTPVSKGAGGPPVTNIAGQAVVKDGAFNGVQTPLGQANSSASALYTVKHGASLTQAQGQFPSQTQSQITASSLINIVAETLPGVAKKLQDRALKNSVELRPNDKPYGGYTDRPHRLGTGAVFEKQTAEQVNAKYQQLSSLPIGEVGDVDHKPIAKSADISLELPLLVNEKPVFVQLHLGPDPDENRLEDEDLPHQVRFSLETDETGPVHAALGIVGKNVRITLWAEQAEFADILNEQRAELDDRLAANGLDLSSIQIRRGHPLSAHFKQRVHIDNKI